ncbi:MAG TPA: hypothetical protein VNQ77_13715 [Frankiaceae bacterium]|nr:hypothetical protein [Frankiaceae bacterium]
MGLRAARNSFAAVAAFALLALPAAASAETSKDKDRGRPAQSQSEVKAEAKAEPKNDAKAEPAAKAEPKAKAEAKGKPSPAPTTSPQPKSNADMNEGGANNGGDCGAYCSTRDGSPSENGKGDGEANGKPCAGCVGKADNKNPPGQAPDGSDHNAGYECDRNQGIGKTNPAHTGCTPQPSVSPTTEPPCVPTAQDDCEPDCVSTPEDDCEPDCVPTPEDDCEPDCVPTPEEPCVTPSVLPTESEKPEPPTTTPSVKGVKYTRTPQAPPAVLGSRLPTTGSNASVALLLLVGFGLVAGGVAVTVAGPARQH